MKRMSSFPHTLEMEVVEGGWKLLEPFPYKSGILGCIIIVPVGYVLAMNLSSEELGPVLKVLQNSMLVTHLAASRLTIGMDRRHLQSRF